MMHSPLPTKVDLELAVLDGAARLLITELVSNSVRHACVAAGSQVRLDIDVEPDRLRIEVRDEGRNPLEPVTAIDPTGASA